jgi:hypothetical protein
MNLPQSVVTANTTTNNITNSCRYVELYANFDMAWNFSSNTNQFKSIQWLKDLCVWLKDNTGLTAKTLTLGTGNMANMNNLYLTYDSSDINNITWVDSSTPGAITATAYCTQVKNWTLS